MHTTKLLAIASVFALLTLPLTAAEKSNSVYDCWHPAFMAGDADAVAKCYAPDAVSWLSGAPTMRGRDAIRAGYAGYFAETTIKSAKLVEMGRFAHGNEVAAWGTFTVVSVSKKDGKETIEHGRYTDVSRKIGGHWMYVVDHASDDPPAAPAN
ncbi:MAG: nuclear transport factor 2 family protein [Rhodanobacter sp.]